MTRIIIIAILAIVGTGCMVMLILSPMDRLTVLISNSIGRRLFPHLDIYRRQQKLKLIAGMILACIVAAGLIYLLLKAMNHHPHR
jgi:hypothetical protein